MIEFKKKKPAYTVATPEEIHAKTKQFQVRTPAVNIIPRSVLQEYRVAAVRNKLIAAVVVMVVALVALFAFGQSLQSKGNAELEALESQILDAESKTQSLAAYQTYYNAIDMKRQELGKQLVNDVNVGDAISLVNQSAIESNISLDTVSVSLSGAADQGVATCPSPDPFSTSASAGCISFSGSTSTRDDIGRFVESLDAIPGFDNAYIPSSTIGETGDGGPTTSAVTGTVSFNAELYSQKYNNLTLPLTSILSPVTDTEAPAEADTAETPAESIEAPLEEDPAMIEGTNP
jgi:hypothetical protein